MAEIETDYLVVGAGASGMGFVDTLLSMTDARVVLVDRETRPGGHWLHAYPFVQLHQPSANYGVASRPLGHDRIDTEGHNAGFYERASSGEICDHLAAALDDFLGTGRVTFLGSTEYRGRDGEGHTVVSLDTGDATTVRARKLVDATYVESEIPSRHTPSFEVDADVRLIPPNDLPGLPELPQWVTVLGSGKTATDTITWLLDSGVDAEHIRWVKPREAWLFQRAFMQPLDLVASYMQMQAHWVTAAAAATDGHDFARRLDAEGVLVRVDESLDADMFRGAIISMREIEALRSVEDVVRKGRVRRLGTDQVLLDEGELSSRPGEVYVDCTARGVQQTGRPDIFESDRITLAYTTLGITPYSAATVAAVEASVEDDAEKNRLCPSLAWSGRTADLLELARTGMVGLTSRMAHPGLAAWTESCRLNPARGAIARASSDPAVGAALTTMISNIGAALDNLARRVGAEARA
jgi:cation diffusion facilitator CzcD-associated flavoprotein CzcO